MNRLITYLCIICVPFIFTNCNHSQFKGYTKSKTGFYYKLIKIGDDSAKCQYNDFITADISYRTMKDSLFFSGRRKFQTSKTDFPGSIDECLTLLGKDDSASFIISGADFFKKTLVSDLPSFIKEGDYIKVDVNVADIETPEQYAHEKEAFLSWIEDFGEYEKTVLKQYLESSKLDVNRLTSGMYYLILKNGNDKAVNIGDTVVVDYEGRFLNGKFFDSTIKRKESFQFVYGQQWQVIKGMEEAIGLMHEGEKALFIMPSDLAFGQSGSSTGIIPPYTSLIFEVELLKVNKI